MSDAVDRRLADLGAAVAKRLDADAPRDRLATQRERFLDAAAAPPRRARRWPVVAAACALAALAVTHRAATPPTLVATTLRGRALGPGQWVARDGEADAIRFSDRSAVRLERGAQVRLGAVHPDGAEVILERGELIADITHRARARWRFYAGPWTVSVTGTAFRLGWSPTTARLDLSMRDGQVVVTGPRASEGRVVRAGERVVAEAERGVVAFAAAPTRSVARELTVTAYPIAPTPPRAAPPQVVARPRRAPRPALADAGTPAVPLARVEAPADDPRGALAAADRARFEGRVTDARALLLALRERHPGTAEATRAAHNLGVLSLESLGAPAVAARWFEIALREAPDGPLSRESLGRRVQALRQAGDEPAAREAAARYLARDPDGAFAPFARGVLAR